MRVRVGPSGYAYKERPGTFYAERAALGDMLSLYGADFGAVEINNAFYRTPQREVVRQGREQVSESFRSVLASTGRITPKKRLQDAADDMGSFVRASEQLEDTGRSTLLQHAPSLRSDAERLLAILPDQHEIECFEPTAASFVEHRSRTA